MEKVGIIINKRLNQHQIAQSARASEIVFKANQHINKWLKCETDEARAMTLKDGVLWVGTGNAVWSQETRNISDNLLRKLQDEYSETYVKKIRIKSLTIK